MIHADQLKEAGFQREGAVKTAMGQFYTPELIIDDLMPLIVDRLKTRREKNIRAVDPFCGDGRLIAKLLEEASDSGLQAKWKLELWDYDDSALPEAKDKVRRVAEETGIEVEIETSNRDSLLESSGQMGCFDCVVTNPPWDTVKPDSRELEGLSDEEKEKFRAALKEYDRRLEDTLPLSQPTRKYAGWGTNLSRCGTELALRLTADSGVCGLVTPLSLLMDQTTRPLRRFIIREAHFSRIAYYPAEAKLFEGGVDQESISFVLEKNTSDCQETEIIRYNRNRELSSREMISVSEDLISDIDHCIPVVFGGSVFRALEKWDGFRTLDEYEEMGSLWLGRELDETRHREWLSKDGEYLFTKGRMVGRYRFLERPESYVDERKKDVPDSANRQRIAWRDVARRSRSRRVQATIVDSGLVTGNSLHVGYFRDDDLQKLKALLVLFNSLPFEFQVRALLGTGHISLGVVRKVRIPPVEHPDLSRILSEMLDEKEVQGAQDEAALEVAAATAYGLSRSGLEEIMSHFRNLPSEYESRILDHHLWNSERLKPISALPSEAESTGAREGHQLSFEDQN